jgi:hypothetical protein
MRIAIEGGAFSRASMSNRLDKANRALGVAIVVGGVLFYHPLPRAPRSAELDTLVKEGESLVSALEQHRTEHGGYPLDLPAVVAVSSAARYGGWKYSCITDCSRFELHVGRYGDFAFEIWWRPETKSWYVDT